MSQPAVHIYRREDLTLLHSTNPESAPEILDRAHIVGYRTNARGKHWIVFSERRNCLGCVEDDGSYELAIRHLRQEKANSKVIYAAI